MWAELLDIFRGGQPMKKMGNHFMEMLGLTHQMMEIVQPHIFDHSLSLEQRSKVYELDVKVNKLERKVRKMVVSHLGIKKSDVPYCLLLMTLVKDAERVGDYVKNVSEVSELGGGPVPDGPLRQELADLVAIAMKLFKATPDIIGSQNREEALELIQEGRAAGKRCDRLLVELAKTDMNASQVTSMVLLTRFHKRIGGHLLNILSSVVMPLHKVDFYDEKEIL